MPVLMEYSELTHSQKESAVEQEIREILSLLSQGVSGTGDPELDKKIAAAWAEVDRLRTPWFFAEVLLKTAQDEIYAWARANVEMTYYAPNTIMVRQIEEEGNENCSSDDPNNHQGNTCPVHES